MTDFNGLVDADRIQRAKAAFAALKVAEAEATAAVEAAQQAVDAAEETSVAAAHAGKPDKTLEALEVACEDAARTASVASKKLTAATKRVADGAAKLAMEIRQAHAVSLTQSLGRRIEIVRLMHAMAGEMRTLNAEFLANRTEALKIAHAAGVGTSGPDFDLVRGLLDSAALDRIVRLEDWAPHLVDKGFDPETGKPRWAE